MSQINTFPTLNTWYTLSYVDYISILNNFYIITINHSLRKLSTYYVPGTRPGP